MTRWAPKIRWVHPPKWEIKLDPQLQHLMYEPEENVSPLTIDVELRHVLDGWTLKERLAGSIDIDLTSLGRDIIRFEAVTQAQVRTLAECPEVVSIFLIPDRIIGVRAR